MEQKDQTASANALDQPSDSGAPSAAPGSDASSEANLSPDPAKPPKKINPVKKFFKRFNLYFLIFIFICIIAGAVTVVSFLNSKKAPETPSIATQELDQSTLDQLTNSDVTVGGSGQTLTVQGNAIFAGQVLTKSDLGVAGSIITTSLKAGTEIVTPQITVSSKANLNDTQITGLQVSGSTTMQGDLTLQNGLNVAGNSAFNGPVTMNQLNVTNITMSGNGSLRVLNHISFPGASPSRTINNATLGSGGTISIGGSDTTGTISIHTGGGPQAGCYAKITFAQKFSAIPHVIVSPVGNAAGQTQYYVDRDENGFSICTANASPANQTFAFDYFITN